MKRTIATWILVCIATIAVYAQSQPPVITSPNKAIQVKCRMDATGQVYYTVQYNDRLLLDPSRLGLRRADADFSRSLTLTGTSSVKTIKDKYELLTGKKHAVTYTANEQTLHFKNASGEELDIIFRVSNDGLAFRYYFPGKSDEPKKIDSEFTSFRFPADAKAWLQPMSVAKSGWEKVNPCYEEFYEKAIKAGTPAPLKAGWVFPALFQSAGHWLLITEAAMDGKYCASKLDNVSAKTDYHIAFPDPREVFPGGADNPTSTLPWYSPWRIITIGSLKTIVESTLGTDLANAANDKQDFSFAKPGKSAWSWALLKDDSTVYRVQKRFIDYAADMQWQYCLIDADWDIKIGYDSVQLLVNYAKEKNVGIWLWYNSAGSWNTAPYHPRNKLLTHEDREKEFSRLEQMGVAGVKIDFFGGDGQSMLQYYIDIMNDAAAHHLMVNFHGATLPRGWQRTWPNLVSTEAIKGFEYITFDQRNANEEPTHCAMLPFTRNAFDPMDFTPMSLYKIPRIKRLTTPAFELALSVLFLSGAQHLVEIPEGMEHMPAYVKDFLRQLPVLWDNVQFIDGYPGEFVVVARQSGSKWYIAGINGTEKAKTISLNLDLFKGKQASYIFNGTGEAFFNRKIIPLTNAKKPLKVTMGARDGFVIVVE
jgi:hypothetical protein